MNKEWKKILEGKLSIEFQGEILKYDESKFYREKVERCKGNLDENKEIGTKAVDVIAFDEKNFYFLEIKDFRGSETENKVRLKRLYLATEFAFKIKDTLAALSGVYLIQEEELLPYAENLFCNSKTKSIQALLLIEGDFSPKQTENNFKKYDFQNLKDKLKTLLKFTNIIHIKIGNIQTLNQKTNLRLT